MSRINVFLSDLHIGTSAETNWYQREYHQEMLKTVLSYIIDNGEKIGDVIILGDWFEQWNYMPTARVPELKTIFERNPELFTRSHDNLNFITAMEAIKGNIRYVNGDHDMLAELSEINRLFGAHTDKKVLPGHGNDCAKASVANTFYLNGKVWAEHGHQNDLFHKPSLNEENPCAPLPLGYFISRLYCHFLDKRISSMHRRDAACISGCSDSEFANLGLHLVKFMEELVKQMKGQKEIDAAQIVVDQLMQFNRNFHVEFNLKSEGFGMIDSLQIGKYFPGVMSYENFVDTLFEAEVAYAGLGRFANKHFCENPGTKVVVMGHTHRPVFELAGAGDTRLYVNSGYLCPSRPDIESATHLPTFVAIEALDKGKIEVSQKIVQFNKVFAIVDGPAYQI
ncbi:MAG: hypothetical protein PWR01_2241 [Clostridiales bacterium]|jgi:predicted phosphodiesterase|nr:hypothetical protein [Clostridiales bacterium]MDN5281168.1 hypothetical protein [Candidatus Ozemobacter sp.]